MYRSLLYLYYTIVVIVSCCDTILLQYYLQVPSKVFDTPDIWAEIRFVEKYLRSSGPRGQIHRHHTLLNFLRGLFLSLSLSLSCQ